MSQSRAQRVPDAFPDAAAAYEGVRLLIYKIVHRWRGRRGGQFEELLSEAHLGFVTAFRSYDGSSPFAAWVTFVVQATLLETARTKATKAAREPERVPLPPDLAAPVRERVPLLLAEAEEDAALAIRACLELPDREVFSHLFSLGWSPGRAADAAAQVSELLGG